MQQPPLALDRPVAIIGAGPVGLTAALGLAFHGVPFVVFEDDDALSLDTKAGTTLSRTLEIWNRFGAADAILAKALRVDEIGEIDRASGQRPYPVRMHVLGSETRYPFVINLPQHHMEPVLAECLRAKGGEIRLQHRLSGLAQDDGGVMLQFATAQGAREVAASFVLGCDGGRSTVRELLGVEVDGHSNNERYALIDLIVDLDVENRRDYPYLSYFSDAQEWMILVRHPHCWRFLFPLPDDVAEPSAESLRDKALAFIGQVKRVEIHNKVIYRTHHRVAGRWRDGRVFLMGDAAHLITPMWALGLNTGVLDASNLPWRLAWFLRGWASAAVLDGYEREQRPLALHGSGEMAEAARAYMAKRAQHAHAMTDNNWSNAYTRGMLGVRVDVAGNGASSLVKSATAPALQVGDRLPDALVHTPQGREVRLHDLCRDRFTALYFTDVRRRPAFPRNDSPALAHFVVSRWDAPLDAGLRDRALLDPGDRLFARLAVAPDSIVLVRPDEHVAAIARVSADAATRAYAAVTGMAPAR